MEKKTFINLFLLMIGCVSKADFQADYFFRSLGTIKLPDCRNAIYDSECRSKCSGTIVCIVKAGCHCKPEVIPFVSDYYNDVDKVQDEFDYRLPAVLQIKVPNDEVQTERPNLRHHIAHFCPNLDVARDCIKHCMNTGKPAFCGKDHQCYCGHKGRDKDKSINATEVYSQFQDLYAKYFGADNSAND
ncbi:uncharacterized protein LOC134199099 [Bombyx mori]|uniref:uncharacterized protein LOC134199099 n=1 Tax=Bombyx mori TaxID=7091 RepID=UPI002ED17D4E